MERGYGIDTKTDRPQIVLLRDGTLRWFDANTGNQVNLVISDALRDATQADDSPDERWLAVVGRAMTSASWICRMGSCTDCR